MSRSRVRQPRLVNGEWKGRIDGNDVDLGSDEAKAFREFHRLMFEATIEDVDESEILHLCSEPGVVAVAGLTLMGSRMVRRKAPRG